MRSIADAAGANGLNNAIGRCFDTTLERQGHLTNLEHWRDLAVAHPWPLGIALLSIVWLIILIPWPHTPDAQRDMVGDDDGVVAARTLDASQHVELPADGVILAESIHVVGQVLLTGPAFLIANEIVFAPNSRIWLPSGELTVIAPHIVDGSFDVSGADGRNGHRPGDAGSDGGSGGTAYVAAAEFTRSTVTANGGGGGNGQRGYAGAAGRNGYCGPRGYGLAARGKTGGNGGAAGNGGSAGLITVWYGDAAPRVSANEGKPGNAGRGGPGGRGGAGCKGVRGSQPAQPAGNEGATGHDGSRGQPGTLSKRHVEFSAVIDAYERWHDEKSPPQSLLEYLRALPVISD